jgi:tetratricopeptide (TPR) repeat protein
MKNVFRFNILILLLVFLAVNITAQELTREEKRNRKKEIRKLLKECVSQYNSEDYDSVQTITDSILILERNNADAIYYKSLSYYHSGDTTTTLESLRQGVEISPLSSRLKILLARILLTQNNTNEAVVVIDAVLTIKPKLPEALYLKGLSLLAQNDSTQAVIFFQKSLEYQIFKD